MRIYYVIQVSLICIFQCSAATAEQSTQCVDFDIRVIAPDTELVGEVCDVVQRAKSLLERCHLVQSRSLIIRVQNDGVFPGYLAHFSPQNGHISLPLPGSLVDNLAKDSAYRAIPTDHLFDSLIVHELAHAFFANTKCGLETCRAGHEYIAYAMQLSSMPERSRALFLAELPSQDNVDLNKFSDLYLDLTPESFAADAWRHFSEAEHGCSFIGDVVSGQVTFSSEFE